MELSQLSVFQAVVAHKSFSEAGRRLYISHSNASRTVAALEKELGVKLLERSNNQVLGLTAAGEELLRGSRELLELSEKLAENVRRAAENKTVDE